MTNQTRKMKAKSRAARRLTVIRWEFMRGTERMSCQIDRAMDGLGAATYAVIGLPYERLKRASVEVFQSATAAFRCHAALATDLRATGWKLVSYTS